MVMRVMAVMTATTVTTVTVAMMVMHVARIMVKAMCHRGWIRVASNTKLLWGCVVLVIQPYKNSAPMAGCRSWQRA